MNGRTFLNNVSVGIYGDAVQEAAYRDAKTRTLLATARARLALTAEARGLRVVDYEAASTSTRRSSSVSNGPYALERPTAPGSRPSPQRPARGIILLDAPADRARPPGRSWTAPKPRRPGDRAGPRGDRRRGGGAPGRPSRSRSGPRPSASGSRPATRPRHRRGARTSRSPGTPRPPGAGDGARRRRRGPGPRDVAGGGRAPGRRGDAAIAATPTPGIDGALRGSPAPPTARGSGSPAPALLAAFGAGPRPLVPPPRAWRRSGSPRPS